MIKWPHTYLINKWFGSLSDETAPIYRTNDINDFIEHAEDVIKKYNLTKNNSRIIVRGDMTFLSFYEGYAGTSWENIRYFSIPEEVYSTLDEYKRSKKKEIDRVCRDSLENVTYMTA